MSENKIFIDILCSERKPEGFIRIDIVKTPSVDIVADLNDSFPIKDDFVDVLRAHDALEHLKDKIFTMSEIYRICKNDALVDIKVPSTNGRGAFQDHTHVSYWNINSFYYYSEQYPDYLSLSNKYGFKGKFRIIEIFNISSIDNVIYLSTKLKVIK